MSKGKRAPQKDLENTEYNRARVTLKKIEHQIPQSREAYFVYAIFSRAVYDCFSKYKVPVIQDEETREYLRKRPNPHLKLLEIDTEWAAQQFKIADTTIMA